MAFNAACVWEVRSGASANNVGGGLWNPNNGTANTSDYSQQNAPQYSQTAGAATNGSPVLTHASAAADMVGNGLRIVSGTNSIPGWYEVISVVVGVSITLDRSIANGVSSNIVFNVGGAISLGHSTDNTFFSQIIAGNKVWIKGGTYTLGATVTLTTSGGTQQPIVVEGYESSRGDRPTGSTRPLINTGAAIFASLTNWDWYYLQFTGTGTSVFALGISNKLVDCKAVNTSTTAARNGFQFGSGITNTLVIRCEGISYRGRAINIGSTAVGDMIIGCYFHDSDLGFMSTSTTVQSLLVNNIFEGNITAAIQFTGAKVGATIIQGNTIYGAENKLGIGLSIATGSTNIRATNNIFYGLASGITHADSQTVSYSDYNTFFNNTSNSTNWALGPNDKTINPSFLSVSQITGATATTSGSVLTQSGADFSSVTDNVDLVYIVSGTGITAGYYLITGHTTTTLTLDIAPGTSAVADKVFQVTSGHNLGVGDALAAQGFPNIFPAGLTTSFMDIGAAQKAAVGGYSRTRVVNA